MIDEVTKILIVDDNVHDRAALRRYLERHGDGKYEFSEGPTVDEAIDICLQVQPHCILLDYQLNDGTGLDFIQQLHQRVPPGTFPIVMLTATGNETIAVEAMKAGVQDYLIKGKADPEVMVRAIRDAIYRTGTRRLLATQQAELQRLYNEAYESNLRKDQLLHELESAKVEAERANAAKDEFIAALSHELRTPLTPVLSAVSSLDPEASDRAEMLDTFRMIQRNIELEARLIDDLLDLTRISKGKLRMDMRALDLDTCLRNSIGICAPDFEQKNVKLTTDLQTGRVNVLADSARLHQVFWNILKNAVKFTPEGGHVEVASSLAPDNKIKIEIRDSGIGIERESLPNIFRAFEQGDRQITRNFGGLGLGLAISKALIDVHGGTIEAESAGRHQGTLLRVSLPVAAHPSANDNYIEETTRRGISRGRGSILLVEDHKDTAAVLSRALKRKGFEVQVAHAVKDAAELFETCHFDMVISDIGLPDGNGIDLINRLNPIRRVPAIALSGYGMEHDVEKSRAAGFVEHLTKPVNWESLYNVIERVLASKPA
ncbi:MAG TPA: response regulator [Chthoniobacteraceae bacterium]|nr:response regulator [Chthoniobacteraceae bacterium]